MRAVAISKFGPPDVLRLTEVADPVPGPGEVLIDVAAAGVNRADLLQRQGFYNPPPGASRYPGLECAGTIAAVGPGVDGWAAGDAVCALLTGGGYATRVAVPAGQLLPVPAGLSLVQAAALPEATCTVHSNVFTGARLRAGETLLVHGGSSGIGTMTIQLARHAGATVAVTAGSAQKLAACQDLGAQILINYKEQDFPQALREATSGHGADVILDIMGASYLGKNVAALAADGRLAIIGMQGGVKGEVNLSELMAKRATILCTTLRARPVAQRAEVVAGVRADVWPLVEAGEIRPVIHCELPLAEAAEAHRIMAGSAHTGKIVLTTQ
ncbi:MAG TPA: NAD(P)H-quinone oxidoreductase [Trebonia sp.]|nr:NAD(P)H-quinone oxidoreductase [Trebonia sp.]